MLSGTFFCVCFEVGVFISYCNILKQETLSVIYLGYCLEGTYFSVYFSIMASMLLAFPMKPPVKILCLLGILFCSWAIGKVLIIKVFDKDKVSLAFWC